MDLIDSKYISLVSSRLQKFKRVKSDLYNFRCPICGDSQRNKNKARGYLYAVKNNTNFKCHNCGASMSFNNLLKQMDPSLHGEYTLEKYKNGFTGKNFVVDTPKFEFEKPVFQKKLDLPKATASKIANDYLVSRKIDTEKFYFADKFKEFVNSLKPTFSSTEKDEPRIIIPLFYNQNLVGFQGRALGPNLVKYITVMLDDNGPKIYGLDSLREGRPVYVTEGPFDSTFIPNSVAMCGADGNLNRWGINDPIYVFDNEPRNREIVSRISAKIESGNSIVIYPSSVKEKDINDMVLAGHDVMDVLKSNTYSGLEAKVKFTEWKKV